MENYLLVNVLSDYVKLLLTEYKIILLGTKEESITSWFNIKFNFFVLNYFPYSVLFNGVKRFNSSFSSLRIEKRKSDNGTVRSLCCHL